MSSMISIAFLEYTQIFFYKNLYSLGKQKLENYWSEHFYPQKSLISYGFLKKISQIDFDVLGSKSKLIALISFLCNQNWYSWTL